MYISLFELSYYAAIFFTIFGAILGLMAVWFEEFWKSETASKLLVTDAIFFATSVAVALITKFLGG